MPIPPSPTWRPPRLPDRPRPQGEHGRAEALRTSLPAARTGVPAQTWITGGRPSRRWKLTDRLNHLIGSSPAASGSGSLLVARSHLAQEAEVLLADRTDQRSRRHQSRESTWRCSPRRPSTGAGSSAATHDAVCGSRRTSLTTWTRAGSHPSPGRRATHTGTPCGPSVPLCPSPPFLPLSLRAALTPAPISATCPHPAPLTAGPAGALLGQGTPASPSLEVSQGAAASCPSSTAGKAPSSVEDRHAALTAASCAGRGARPPAARAVSSSTPAAAWKSPVLPPPRRSAPTCRDRWHPVRLSYSRACAWADAHRRQRHRPRCRASSRSQNAGRKLADLGRHPHSRTRAQRHPHPGR